MNTKRYEVWALLDGERPELVAETVGIFLATLKLATLMASRDPEKWTFWVQCPERSSSENHEGIELRDWLVIKAAQDLAQSRRRRRVYLSNTGGRMRIEAKGHSMVELLFMSIQVVQGKAKMAKLPTDSELAEVQWQLRFA